MYITVAGMCNTAVIILLMLPPPYIPKFPPPSFTNYIPVCRLTTWAPGRSRYMSPNHHSVPLWLSIITQAEKWQARSVRVKGNGGESFGPPRNIYFRATSTNPCFDERLDIHRAVSLYLPDLDTCLYMASHTEYSETEAFQNFNMVNGKNW